MLRSRFPISLLVFVAVACSAAAQDDWLDAGPVFDHFRLTLEPGERTEVLGPLFYTQQADTRSTVAVPPLFSVFGDPAIENRGFDFVYPVLTYDRYGDEYRFQIFQLFSFAGGQRLPGTNTHRFTLFPIYFQQRSEDPALNYTALVPLGGTLQNRFFGRDEIEFVLFPIWAKTRKRDVVTKNVLFPIFHVRHGDGLVGFQIWPLMGREDKAPTTRTDQWGDTTSVPGYDKRFMLWPIFSGTHTGLGTTNPAHHVSLLPLFSYERSPSRDFTMAPWPIGFSYADDRGRGQHEWGFPWPVFVISRGDSKRVTRFWPIYTHGTNATLDSTSLLWPLYVHKRVHDQVFERERTRVAFFLFSDTIERNRAEHTYLQRQSIWPFYQYQREHDGNRRFQTLALLEPLFPLSESIRRNYSPLWTLYQSETNATTHAASQSALWNLYRHDSTTNGRKSSLLFGLVQWQTGADGGHTQRWFYLPRRKVY